MARNRWREFWDPHLLAPLAGLMVVSLFNLYSASQRGQAGTPYLGQALWFLVGSVVLALSATVSLKALERYAFVIYGLALVPLVLVHFIGRKAGGATSWIALGPVGVQPSEPMKIALLIALAWFLGRPQNEPPYGITDLVRPGALLAIPLALILKEPDMGTAILYLAVVGSLLLYVGIERKIFWGSIAIVVVAVGTLWLWKGDPLYFLKAHQKARIATFLDPESDPLGVGYHVIQSKIAIGSGGFFGRGYLKGLQTQFSYLPEQHTDFAFSVFAEEMGFFFSSLVLALLAYLIVRAFRLAALSRDVFSCTLSAGIGLLLLWHCVINLGMVVGILPVIGVPLPLISYGGSSAVTVFCAVGLLLNVSRARNLF